MAQKNHIFKTFFVFNPASIKEYAVENTYPSLYTGEYVGTRDHLDKDQAVNHVGEIESKRERDTKKKRKREMD